MKSNIREVHFAGFPTLAITNASATNAGNYSVVVTSPCGSVTSAVATVTVQAPPVITLQPTNQTVLAGSSPTFSVTAAGSGTFEYLWYFAGTNLVQSGRSSSLTLPNVFTNNAGSYTAVVINTWGSVTSAVASLTVTIPTNAPQIVTGDGCCGFLDNQFGFNLSGAYRPDHRRGRLDRSGELDAAVHEHLRRRRRQRVLLLGPVLSPISAAATTVPGSRDDQLSPFASAAVPRPCRPPAIRPISPIGPIPPILPTRIMKECYCQPRVLACFISRTQIIIAHPLASCGPCPGQVRRRLLIANT